MAHSGVHRRRLHHIWTDPDNHRINLVLHQEATMNAWVFFNNLLFGCLAGFTMGFIRFSQDTDMDEPAYTTAWIVGNLIGWVSIAALLIRIYNLEGLFT